MPDPIRDLANLRGPVTSTAPLPAAEVRRRGDRLRRRRNGLVAGAAAAAVAVVVSGAVAAGSFDVGDRQPPPAVPPATPEPPEPAIPEDFALDAGMTGARVADDVARWEPRYCGTAPLVGLDARHVRTAVDDDGDATASTRTLYLLASGEAARAARQEVAEAAWVCSFADPGLAGSGDVTIHETVESWPGDTITEDFRDVKSSITGPFIQVVHVVTRGPALLVTLTVGEWGGDVERAVARTRARVRPVVEMMKVFEE